MATNPIDYFAASTGTPPWTTLQLIWDGTESQYTLFQAGNPVSLNVGPETSYTFTGQPDSRYDFRLETSTLLGLRAQTLTAYTAALPAPSGLQVLAADSTSITLTWQAVIGATGYEVASAADAYQVISSGTSTEVTIGDLSANTRYSFAVRTVLDDTKSKWTRPVAQFTSVTPNVTAGIYEFVPASAAVWQSGIPELSEPEWQPTANDYRHGNGWVWGSSLGRETTYFFYGAPNPFLSLVGATPTRLQVYLERTADSGSPSVTLSRWALHGYATKPSGEPTLSETVYDSGEFARGQSGWVDLPTEWASVLLVNSTHKGIAWGGVDARYQVAPNASNVDGTVTGTLRITVN